MLTAPLQLTFSKTFYSPSIILTRSFRISASGWTLVLEEKKDCVHDDLKPESILILGTLTAAIEGKKVNDFGLPFEVSEAQRESFTFRPGGAGNYLAAWQSTYSNFSRDQNIPVCTGTAVYVDPCIQYVKVKTLVTHAGLI